MEIAFGFVVFGVIAVVVLVGLGIWARSDGGSGAASGPWIAGDDGGHHGGHDHGPGGHDHGGGGHGLDGGSSSHSGSDAGGGGGDGGGGGGGG